MSAHTMAYERPSCAYIWTMGRRAKVRPPMSPVRGPTRRFPVAATRKAETEVASTDGSLSVTRPSPPTANSACMKK